MASPSWGRLGSRFCCYLLIFEQLKCRVCKHVNRRLKWLPFRWGRFASRVYWYLLRFERFAELNRMLRGPVFLWCQMCCKCVAICYDLHNWNDWTELIGFVKLLARGVPFVGKDRKQILLLFFNYSGINSAINSNVILILILVPFWYQSWFSFVINCIQSTFWKCSGFCWFSFVINH